MLFFNVVKFLFFEIYLKKDKYVVNLIVEIYKYFKIYFVIIYKYINLIMNIL